jgi:hypothetical protein
MNAMTLKYIQSILSNIKYKNWDIVAEARLDCFVIQVQFQGINVDTGKMELQKCRKWFISQHACLNEVVTTAHKAVEAAEKHEMNENFKYYGYAIFNPHLHPDLIADMMEKLGSDAFNTRNS